MFTATALDQGLTLGQVTYPDYETNIYAPVRRAAPVQPKGFPNSFPRGRSSYNRLTSYRVADTMTFADGLVELPVGVQRQQIDAGNYPPVTGRVSSAYDQGATTPAFGLVVWPTQALSLYANAVEGLTALRAPSTALNANQMFAPARTQQYKIGSKLDFQTFGVTLAAFEITSPPGGLDPDTNRFGTIGNQRNRGHRLRLDRARPAGHRGWDAPRCPVGGHAGQGL